MGQCIQSYPTHPPSNPSLCPFPEPPPLPLAPGHPNCSADGSWGGGWKFWYHSPEEVLELSSAEGPAGNPQSQSPSARLVHEVPELGGPQDSVESGP